MNEQISNLEFSSILKQTAAALANMLDENKEEKVLKEACVRLCQLFGEGIQNDRIQAILEANVVPKLVALLRPSRARAVPITVQSAALQVLGNVACGDDRQTQVVIDSEALPCLRALLASADRGIRKEVCWIVSNITESSHQVQDVLDADILPPLLKLLDSQDAACREDATWVLFNLSSNREPKQISYLADKNGVRALCNLLTCGKDLDVLWKGCGTVAAVALKGLRNILICGQSEAATHPLGYNRMAALVADAHGVERIEALTAHASHDVRLRARLLLERMFGAEPSTVDLQPVPSAPANASSVTSTITPAPPIPNPNCSCNYDHRQTNAPSVASAPASHSHHHQHHPSHYPPPTFDPPPVASSPSPLEQNGLPNHGEQSGSTSPSTTDSDPEDEDSDSDLIPPPPAPCSCALCTDTSPLSDRRPRGKPVDDLESDMYQMCEFCSGFGRLGDGRAGLAAKLGRAVRLGHSHCLAVLLSRMTWSQRTAATDAPALLHPGGGPAAGGTSSNVPAVTLAAQLGKPDCLALLLRRCKPDLTALHGKRKYTPLAWAASKGYVRCTRLLIEHGADPATRCAEGTTALHLAAWSSGNSAICKMLLDCGAPVNALTEKKQTPLCLAAQKGNWKIAQLLLQHGADPNNEDVEKYTPVHLAASNGFVDCLNLLLKANASVDCKTLKGITPLHYAVQGGHASCVRLLINAGAKVNCAKKPLLLIAADEGKPEVVQILLDALAVIDCKAYVKAYLDKENEISDHLTPLHLAASKGNLDVVELLLRGGANVDSVTDNSKWTALDFSVLNGHSQCAIVLLKHGATVSENCKNVGRNNWTLVQYAAQQGAKEVVRLLVERVQEQRMKAKNTGKFQPGSPEFVPSTTSTTDQMLAPLAAAPDSLSFPQPPARRNSNCAGSLSHHQHHVGGSSGSCNLNSSSSAHDQYPMPHLEESRAPPVTPSVSHFYDAYNRINGNNEKRCTQGLEGPCGNGNVNMPPEASGSTRRRAPKEDRDAIRRARDIKKREEEAADARVRLDEAISQRSIAKLTEAISHVSKLVLHLATTSNSADQSIAPNGGVSSDYPDDPYGNSGYTDPGVGAPVPPANGATNGRHASSGGTVAGGGGSASYSSGASAPLPVEVGLGNEVMKARKMLAELQGEERRARDERAREAADNKRDTAQQSVLKAMNSTLQGGDSRILVRTVNRALRTILDSDDVVILEAKEVSRKIENLEKAEEQMSVGKRDRNLELLRKAVPIVENGLEEVRAINGQGAAERIFGPSGPETAIYAAKKLCEELMQEQRAAEEQRVEAEDRERQAKNMLSDAMSSGDLKRMEDAIESAIDAVISKDSELASAIDSAKKSFAKILKGERRKLRQANGSNDADTIDAAVKAAIAKGLRSLEADIKTSKHKAQKLRDQKQAKLDLVDAVSESDMTALTELRSRLKDLGMFEEEERAKSELDRLQRAARARSTLENAISGAKENIDTYRKKKASKSKEGNKSGSDWVWPDTQKLYDIAERSRKYGGGSMQKLCDSALELLKNLGATGREVLRNSINSDDATIIAASISGYEKSFIETSCCNLFGKEQGNRIIAEARKKLAQVQAADQAKVRAESRQVKQSFAMANSRRHNVKNRVGRKERSAATKNEATSNASTTPLKETSSTITTVLTNGAKTDTSRSAAGEVSNNSSEYGGDDEASDVDALHAGSSHGSTTPAATTPMKEILTPTSSTVSSSMAWKSAERLPSRGLNSRNLDPDRDGGVHMRRPRAPPHILLPNRSLDESLAAENGITSIGGYRVKRRGGGGGGLGHESPPRTGITLPTSVRPGPPPLPPVYSAPIPTPPPVHQQYYGYFPGPAPVPMYGHVGSTVAASQHSLMAAAQAAAAAQQAQQQARVDEEEDLGAEFANQNFGFDIDAIVDDHLPEPLTPSLPRKTRATYSAPPSQQRHHRHHGHSEFY